jgi:anti-anti-sigma factor
LRPIVSFDAQEAVLFVAGDEDRTTSGRRRRPLSCALRASRDVVVDVSELVFADSSLIVDLAVLAQRLRAQGRRLGVRAPQPQIQRLIEMVGLHRMPAVAIEPAGAF